MFGVTIRTVCRWKKAAMAATHSSAPKSRVKRKRKRRHPAEVFARAIELKKEFPRRTAAGIHRLLKKEFPGGAPCESTIRKFLAANGLSSKGGHPGRGTSGSRARTRTTSGRSTSRAPSVSGTWACSTCTRFETTTLGLSPRGNISATRKEPTCLQFAGTRSSSTAGPTRCSRTTGRSSGMSTGTTGASSRNSCTPWTWNPFTPGRATRRPRGNWSGSLGLSPKCSCRKHS